MVLTFMMGVAFLLTQVVEYLNVGFNTGDGAFASVFFGLTGLHGAHVFVGLTLLGMVIVRGFRGHFTPEHHHGVELPGIYWHFVDVMWIVVYASRLPHLRGQLMESPFRSEAAAFRFLLMSIGAFALIVVASWLDPWLGLLVFLALSGAAVWAYTRQRGPSPPREQIEQSAPPTRSACWSWPTRPSAATSSWRRSASLLSPDDRCSTSICPALNSRLRTWTSDEDPARAAAQKRLHTTLERLVFGRHRSAGRRG